jgi:hypothetical protein
MGSFIFICRTSYYNLSHEKRRSASVALLRSTRPTRSSPSWTSRRWSNLPLPRQDPAANTSAQDSLQKLPLLVPLPLSHVSVAVFPQSICGCHCIIFDRSSHHAIGHHRSEYKLQWVMAPRSIFHVRRFAVIQLLLWYHRQPDQELTIHHNERGLCLP